ncbi:hypothetical protein DERP_014326 [Dermatophagoides pteronyssinus]|uniref:Secreted protein n=1 Tax=Dermatophagoides pteronyssinus TaxID=6956 RepID=A0ABQ8JWW8_DERPT|nr:hypothetical protein DERP_014326 [Dermatophagoides pteronyssinus]
MVTCLVMVIVWMFWFGFALILYYGLTTIQQSKNFLVTPPPPPTNTRTINEWTMIQQSGSTETVYMEAVETNCHG